MSNSRAGGTRMPRVPRAEGATRSQNYAAVCQVLRSAANRKAAVVDVELVCAMLGLDPAAALAEARRGRS